MLRERSSLSALINLRPAVSPFLITTTDSRATTPETGIDTVSTCLLGVVDGALHVPVDQDFSEARVDHLKSRGEKADCK